MDVAAAVGEDLARLDADDELRTWVGRDERIVSGLEGALLVARTYGDPQRFETAAAGLLADFAAI